MSRERLGLGINPHELAQEVCAHTKIRRPNTARGGDYFTYIPDNREVPSGCTAVRFYNEGDVVHEDEYGQDIHQHGSTLSFGAPIPRDLNVEAVGDGIPIIYRKK